MAVIEGSGGAGGATVASVVIPAHNEERVIGRCLAALLADAAPGELDVVVVANGCTDRTAEIAAVHPGVRVVETPIASKPRALDLGDEAAASFPRLYVDADIEVGTAAARAVADALRSGSCDLAAPRLRVELAGRPWPVRAFYDVWGRLPYARDDLVGSGFYGLSATARAQFDSFPETMAEDFFVYSLVPPDRRRSLEAFSFTLHPPFTLRSLVRIQARIQAANARNHDLFAAEADELNRGHKAELARLARVPSMLPKVIAYGLVVVAAKAKAKLRNRSTSTGVWDRDHTARSHATTV